MNGNLNFHNSKDINMSNSGEKDINDFLTDDLLSYSEDKSQTFVNLNQNNDNKKKINSHNDNSERTSFLSYKNKNVQKNNFIKNIKKEKNKKIINNNNNINDSNKDLSSLQVSLSNLLSDIDSKDIFFNHNTINNENNSNNNLNKINQKNINNNFNSEKDLINISNEKNNHKYINLKEKYNSNEEHSSSVCNYSQSLHNNNSTNNNKNNDNKFPNNIDNNYIINYNAYSQNNIINSKKRFKYNKIKNINNDNIIKEKRNSILPINLNHNNNKKINNELQINDKKCLTLYNNTKNNFQIEKRENIQLLKNINNTLPNDISNNNLLYNNYNNSKINSFLSINKTQNFTINSSTLEYNNISEHYDIFKKSNITSMELIKEILKNNKLIEKIDKNNNKNKIKLINNKNVEILKEDSKKFFYNPKKKNNSNDIFNFKKNDYLIKKFKTNCNLNLNLKFNNKIKEYNPSTVRNIKKESDLLTNYHNDKKSITKDNINYFSNKNNSYTYNKLQKTKTFNRNILKKENKTLQIKMDMKAKNTLSNINTYNNTINKNKKENLKEKNKIRNVEKSGNKNYSISYNQRGYELKSKNKSILYDYSTENTKPKIIKKQYINYSNNNLINKIKSEQKKTFNKLLTKFSTLKKNKTNIINKGNIYPILSNLFQKSPNNNTIKESTINNNKEKNKIKNTGKGGSITTNIKKKIKINKIVKNKTDDINHKKEIKNKIKDKYIKLNTQINLASLLSNFNNKTKTNRKNHKSLFNFGNIFFIDQRNTIRKGDSGYLFSNIFEKSNNSINKEKVIIVNDNPNNSKINTLNYSVVKHKPQIINDFSNYKKKGNINNKCFDQNIKPNIVRNIDTEYKEKKTDIDINNNIKNNLNLRFKIKDSFQLKKIEGDIGNDIIKGI